MRSNLPRIVSFSLSSVSNEQNSNANQVAEWKKNVVVVPIQTTAEDLKKIIV